jgi:hypothetical protein
MYSPSKNLVINAPAEEIWKHLVSFRGVEKYLPFVTKSDVTGFGAGATRICHVQLDSNIFEFEEILEKVDEEKKKLVVSITNAPPPFAGLKSTFEIISLGKDSSEVTISSSMDPNAPQEEKEQVLLIYKMVLDGLKTLHEKK